MKDHADKSWLERDPTYDLPTPAEQKQFYTEATWITVIGVVALYLINHYFN